MLKTKFTVSDHLPELAEKLRSMTNTLPLMRVIGKAAENTFREHFRAKNLEPNKRGWKKQGFWARIRRATALTEVTADTATITIADPAFGKRLEGGIIRAKPGKSLAIPLRPEAAGIMPRSGIIPNLEIIVARGKAFLVKKYDNSSFHGASDKLRHKYSRSIATARHQRMTIYYILKKSIRVPADPTALPPQSALALAISTAAESYFARIHAIPQTN